MSASIMQNHEFFHRLGQNGIAHIHREASLFGIPFQLKGFSQATIAVQGEQLVHDAPVQIRKGAGLGTAFQGNQET